LYKKKSGMLGIIITIIILILLVFLSNLSIARLSNVENIFSKIVMPIQNGLTYIKNSIAGNDSFSADINNLKNENEELRQKNAELEQSVRELEILKSENATLKEYVGLKEKYGEYETVPAYIINKDITNYNNIMIINAGSEDGIEVNMTVISDKGLVGHIISVTEDTSKVQTILDTSNTVSATVSSSREIVIARGNLGENNLKATYIPTDANLVEGENVETSGMGGIYPKGIHIGTIDKVFVTKNITDRYATIIPGVDFSTVETVLVIKK